MKISIVLVAIGFAILTVGCWGRALTVPQAPQPVMLGPVRFLPEADTTAAIRAVPWGKRFDIASDTSVLGNNTRMTTTRTVPFATDWIVTLGTGLARDTLAAGDAIYCRSVVAFYFLVIDVKNKCVMRLRPESWATSTDVDAPGADVPGPKQREPAEAAPSANAASPTSM